VEGLGLFAPIIQIYSVLPSADPRSGTLYICQAPTWVQIFRDIPGLTLISTDFERFLTKKSTGSSDIRWCCKFTFTVTNINSNNLNTT
jgi:hypothetical protein